MEREIGNGSVRRASWGSALLVLVAFIGSAGGALAQAGRVDIDTVKAGRFDFGKMWPFEYAPAAYFKQTYGVDATPAWLERARLSALRIPGCSASFVSPNGLLVTNHHCARGSVSQVQRAGENLLDNGFYAQSLSDERKIDNYYVDQLIAIEDVTSEVFAAADKVKEEERAAAREAAMAAIQNRLLQRHSQSGATRVEVTPLYHGGRYSAYVFRRYTDVRLVAAAELQLGFFGGDADNFTYPRYALDFAFLRVYDANGQPLKNSHHFGWGSQGVKEGDAVFIIGNPGPTNRLATVAQLEYQRDVSVPASLAFLESHLEALRAYYQAHPKEGELLDIRNRMFGLSNSQKASTGRLAALNDPIIMAKKRDAEEQFRAAIDAKPELKAKYGDLFDRIASLQKQKAAWAPSVGAFASISDADATSMTIRRAMLMSAFLQAQRLGVPADSLDRIRQRLLGITQFPRELEASLLALRLNAFQRWLGANDETTQAVFRGRTTEQIVAAILDRSAFSDSARFAQVVQAGAVTADDPGMQLAQAFQQALMEYHANDIYLEMQEEELESQLGRARFEVYGTTFPPDATSSPRITDGVVRSYPYNGTLAPAFTTFFGMYDRFYTFGKGSEWDLPSRWVPVPRGLDLNTPLNFVSTADTYGGNSGSPAVTKDLRLVGLNFDRNIEGLSRDFIYLPDLGRNIMVDARAIQEALDDVYDADRIVMELTTGRLFNTEREADAARR